MRKIGMSFGLCLGSLVVLSACQFPRKNFDHSASQRSFVSLATTIEKKEFTFEENLGKFVGVEGETLWLYVSGIEESERKNIRFVTYSARAALEAKRLAEAIDVSPKSAVLEQTSIFGHREYPLIELKVEIFKYGLETDSCRAEKNKIAFGCAVNINRALSLADPQELEQGRSLSRIMGGKDVEVMRQYSRGKSPPLLTGGTDE